MLYLKVGFFVIYQKFALMYFAVIYDRVFVIRILCKNLALYRKKCNLELVYFVSRIAKHNCIRGDFNDEKMYHVVSVDVICQV